MKRFPTVPRVLTVLAAVAAVTLGSVTAAFGQYTTTPYTPSGAANPEPVGVSASTVAPGTPVTVSFPSNPSTSGGAGPCAAGAAVTVQLLLIQDGQTPSTLASPNANSNGGLDNNSVTIPSNAPQGTYVLFAECTGPKGETEVLTSAMVLVSSTGSHAAVAATHFLVSPTYGTPAQRQAIDHAVQAQVAASTVSPGGATAASATGAPDGGLNLSIPRLTSKRASSSSDVLTYALAAAVAAMVAFGLVLLRRRRGQAHA